MHSLRFGPFWLAGGIVLVVLVIGGSLAPSDSVGVDFPPDKLMHVFSYFVLMAWFGGLYRKAAHWRIALALFAMGVGLEWLQQLGGDRMPEIADMVANTTGIAAGVIPGVLVPGGWCRHAERIFAG